MKWIRRALSAARPRGGDRLCAARAWTRRHTAPARWLAADRPRRRHLMGGAVRSPSSATASSAGGCGATSTRPTGWCRAISPPTSSCSPAPDRMRRGPPTWWPPGPTSSPPPALSTTCASCSTSTPRRVRAGATLVVGAAVSPGLSGLLARHLAERLERCDELHVAVHGTAGPACAREHHQALAGWAVGWHDGEWIERAGRQRARAVLVPRTGRRPRLLPRRARRPGAAAPRFPDVDAHQRPPVGHPP